MLNRRDLIAMAGAAIALSAADRASATPSPVGKADNAAIAAAAGSCATAAEACLRHCIAMLSSGNPSMSGCAKAVADLGPAARALAAIAPGGSTHVAALAAVVGQIAKDCKTECEKHLSMAPCKACAESCATLIAKIG